MNTKAIEDYVKAIYSLIEREGQTTTNSIAQELHVRAASVTGMLRKLAARGLIVYAPYKSITLTVTGKKIALEVIRHHRLIETFLAEALGVPWDEVHDEAERLEHVISEKLEDRIATVLGHPQFDPHGDPIPARDGSMRKRRLIPLSRLTIGAEAAVAQVCNQQPEVLRYLQQAGLMPGAQVSLVAAEPLAGPVTVSIKKRRQVLARELADQVLVEA